MEAEIAGLILAAGYSRRMGSPKALLTIEGETFLDRIFRIAKSAGLDTIRIVVGSHSEEIRLALPALASNLIINENPELGQLHSLRLGLRSLPGTCKGAMVFLVDHPKVRLETVRSLLQAFNAGEGEIIIPSHGGRRGHPVLFARSVFDDLFSAPLEEGARAVMRGRPDLVAYVEVDDAGVLADIDTPSDYEAMRKDD